MNSPEDKDAREEETVGEPSGSDYARRKKRVTPRQLWARQTERPAGGPPPREPEVVKEPATAEVELEEGDGAAEAAAVTQQATEQTAAEQEETLEQQEEKRRSSSLEPAQPASRVVPSWERATGTTAEPPAAEKPVPEEPVEEEPAYEEPAYEAEDEEPPYEEPAYEAEDEEPAAEEPAAEEPEEKPAFKMVKASMQPGAMKYPYATHRPPPGEGEEEKARPLEGPAAQKGISGSFLAGIVAIVHVLIFAVAVVKHHKRLTRLEQRVHELEQAVQLPATRMDLGE